MAMCRGSDWTGETLDAQLNALQEELADKRKSLGDAHLATLSAYRRLALAYRERGRLADAVDLYESLFAARYNAELSELGTNTDNGVSPESATDVRQQRRREVGEFLHGSRGVPARTRLAEASQVADLADLVDATEVWFDIHREVVMTPTGVSAPMPIEWLVMTAISGVVGNLAYAAVVKGIQSIRIRRASAAGPDLSREDALEVARASLTSFLRSRGSPGYDARGLVVSSAADQRRGEWEFHFEIPAGNELSLFSLEGDARTVPVYVKSTATGCHVKFEPSRALQLYSRR
jgi:hypothetical protein